MNFEKQKLFINEEKDNTTTIRGLEILGDHYPIYDSPLIDFDGYFEGVLPGENRTIKEYISNRYREKIGSLVGIELGGPGSKLFDDLKGYFMKTAGFTLYKKKDAPKTLNHEIIEADVFFKRTDVDKDGLQGYQSVAEWVKKNGGVDIIFERMVGGIPPLDQEMFLQIIKRWYKLLNEEGTMFIQNPVLETRDDLKFMIRLDEYFGNQSNLEFDYAPKGTAGNLFSVIRLKKLPGAPDSLDKLLRK